MTSPRYSRILLGLAAVAAVGAVWWVLTRNHRAVTPEVATPLPVAGHRTETTVAPEVPAPSSIGPSAPTSALAATAVQRVERAPAPVAPAPVVAAIAQSAEPAPAGPSTAPVTDEVAATERMYFAHAPLRTREVADPDSESNRRILQTMVGKALSHESPPSATVAP